MTFRGWVLLGVIALVCCHTFVNAYSRNLLVRQLKEAINGANVDTGDDENCGTTADIVLILDGSSSITRANFDIVQQFAKDLISGFDVGLDHIRIGVMLFNSRAQIQFNLNTYGSPNDMYAAIDRMSKNYGTVTNMALKRAREVMFTEENGNRPESPDIALVVTDGKSLRPSKTAEQARLLRETGVKIFAVGVGAKADVDELRAIASHPSSQFVVQVVDFAALKGLEQLLKNKACEAAKEDKDEATTQGCDEGSGMCPTTDLTTVTPPPTTEAPSACRQAADVVFLMDASSSVGKRDFAVMKQYVQEIVSGFVIGENHVRVGVIVFHKLATYNIKLNDHFTMESLLRAIDELPDPVRGTYTDRALRLLNSEGFSEANGGREHVAHVGIVITDGKSRYPKRTVGEAAKLHDNYVMMFAIGIGRVRNSEIEAIASKPTNRYIYRVDDFKDLLETAKSLQSETCENFSKVKPPCDARVDLGLILDTSTSIGEVNYGKMKTFLADLMLEFFISPTRLRVGAVTFGGEGALGFSLNDCANVSCVIGALDTLPPIRMGTSTHEGLMLARTRLFQANAGDRLGVADAILVITDGRSRRPDETAMEAGELKRLGFKVFVLAVGDVDVTELHAISSKPYREHLFNVANFDGLHTIKSDIAESICKVKLPEISCKKAADVVFLMDASSSVGPYNFETMKEFVKKVVAGFTISQHDTHVGVIVFHKRATLNIRLDEFLDRESLLRAIDELPPPVRGTYTHRALELLNEKAFLSKNGGREHVERVGIVMTDGKSRYKSRTLSEARKLHANGITMFAIGIGDVRTSEIEAIASEPTEKYALTVEDFSALLYAVHPVLSQACESVKLTKMACIRTADLAFVIDASSSVGEENYDRVKDFVKSFLTDLVIGEHNVRVAIIVFNHKAQVVASLDQFYDYKSLSDAIDSMPPPGYGTYTHRALSMLREVVFSESNGAREFFPRIGILVTDGLSRYRSLTFAEAWKVHEKKINMFTIGMGNEIEMREIGVVATPPTDKHSFTVSNYSNINDVMWPIVKETCELVKLDKAECFKAADIVFLLDASSSVGIRDYAKVKSFVKDFISRFKIGQYDVRVAVIVFNRATHLVIRLNDFYDLASLSSAIDDLPRPRVGTYTHLALQMLRLEAFTEKNGGRRHSPRIGIAIMDGDSRHKKLTAAEAEKVHASNITMFAVGVGNIKKKEIEIIASQPSEKFAYTIDDFSQLMTTMHPMITQGCDAVAKDLFSCQKPVDLVFVLDASSSMGHGDYNLMKQFVKEILSHFVIAQYVAHAGVITFNWNATIAIRLDQFYDFELLSRAIDDLPSPRVGTNTHEALRLLSDAAFTEQYGGRRHSPHIAVVVTDGMSRFKDLTKEAAERAHGRTIKVFAVGVGNIRRDEIEVIASSPKEYFAYVIDDFRELKTAKYQLLRHACESAILPQIRCSMAADVAFVIPASNTIDAYNRSRDFIKRIILGFEIGVYTIQSAVVTYNRRARLPIKLRDYHERQTLMAAIDRLKMIQGGTAPHRAVRLLRRTVFREENGGRPDAIRMVVFLVNGQSRDIDKTVREAMLLHRDNIHTFIVGVGDVSRDVMDFVASEPRDRFAFQIDGFDQLYLLAHPILDRICELESYSATKKIPKLMSLLIRNFLSPTKHPDGNPINDHKLFIHYGRGVSTGGLAVGIV